MTHIILGVCYVRYVEIARTSSLKEFEEQKTYLTN